MYFRVVVGWRGVRGLLVERPKWCDKLVCAIVLVNDKLSYNCQVFYGIL